MWKELNDLKKDLTNSIHACHLIAIQIQTVNFIFYSSCILPFQVHWCTSLQPLIFSSQSLELVVTPNYSSTRKDKNILKHISLGSISFGSSPTTWPSSYVAVWSHRKVCRLLNSFCWRYIQNFSTTTSTRYSSNASRITVLSVLPHYIYTKTTPFCFDLIFILFHEVLHFQNTSLIFQFYFELLPAKSILQNGMYLSLHCNLLVYNNKILIF